MGFPFSDLGGRGSLGGLCSFYPSGFLVRGRFGDGVSGVGWVWLCLLGLWGGTRTRGVRCMVVVQRQFGDFLLGIFKYSLVTLGREEN